MSDIRSQTSGFRKQAAGGSDSGFPFASELVSEYLLDWYGRAGRDLPWRQTRDPYGIWLSEIMLQQTTVAAVIGYYQRFLMRFPDVFALAAAPLDEVIDLWAGLGYYARARHLHATARQLVAGAAGEFPRSVEQLSRLPGIGRSTSGAISALAFDQQSPILDGNVRRILCRLFALQQPARSAQAEKQLWLWAETLTPLERVHDYTQAIMDLGATLCTPRGPRCDSCPLETLCQARRLDRVEQLPLKVKSKKIPLRRQLALLLRTDQHCLVQRRPARGLLGGLWEFPTLEATDDDPTTLIRQHLAGLRTPERITLLGRAGHRYSHFQLEVDFYQVDVQNDAQCAEELATWLPLSDLKKLALHGAHKNLLPLIGN